MSLTYLLDSADKLVERGFSYSDIMDMEFWEYEHILKRQIEKDRERKKQQDDEEKQNKKNKPNYKKPNYKPPKYKK